MFWFPLGGDAAPEYPVKVALGTKTWTKTCTYERPRLAVYRLLKRIQWIKYVKKAYSYIVRYNLVTIQTHTPSNPSTYCWLILVLYSSQSSLWMGFKRCNAFWDKWDLWKLSTYFWVKSPWIRCVVLYTNTGFWQAEHDAEKCQGFVFRITHSGRVKRPKTLPLK